MPPASRMTPVTHFLVGWMAANSTELNANSWNGTNFAG